MAEDSSVDPGGRKRVGPKTIARLDTSILLSCEYNDTLYVNN